MRAFATALSLLLTSSILPLSSPLLGQPVPVRAFNVPVLYTFDELGSEGVVAPSGWRVGASEATLSRSLLVGNSLSDDVGAYNVPKTETGDRAVGFLQVRGHAGMIDLRMRNATGSPIDAISISFDAMQWRFSSDTRAQSGLELLFSSDGVTFVSLGDRFSYHAVPDLDFRALVSKNQSVRAVAHLSGRWILPSVLQPDAEWILRWKSTNSQIDGVGFALDNVRVEVSPVLPTADGDGFVTIGNPFLHNAPIFSPGVSQTAVLTMKGRPGGPLVDVSVVPPEGWTIGPSASLTLEGPAFIDTDVSIEDGRISIRHARLTDTETGMLTIGDVAPPAAPGATPGVFRVLTSTGSGKGRDIQEPPRAALLATIESVHHLEGVPPDGLEIACEGTLLFPFSLDKTQGVFLLEDRGWGLRVIFEEHDRGFLDNERLLVVGRLSGGRSSPSLMVTRVVHNGTGRPTARRPGSLGEITADPSSFDGSLVLLRGLRKVVRASGSWPPLFGASSRYLLTDTDGRDSILLALLAPSNLSGISEPRTPMTLRGVILRSGDATSPSSKLYIIPRNAADINPVLTPPAPELRFPEDDAKNVRLMASLVWEDAGDASRYHVQISNDSAFTNLVAEDSLVVGVHYACPTLSSQATYYWRVRAFNADGAGPFSPVRTFSTLLHPTVSILDPDSGKVIETSSVMIHLRRSGFWYPNDPNAPEDLLENQSGHVQVSVGGKVLKFVDQDSLWVVRLERGSNTVRVELVDANRRPLEPPVTDSTVVVVSEDAWLLNARAHVPAAPALLVQNSSSMTLHPACSNGVETGRRSGLPLYVLTVDRSTREPSSEPAVSVTALTPGIHQIRLELVQSDGSPRIPPVFDEFSLAVPDSAPYLKIIRPAREDTLEQRGAFVEIERRNLGPGSPMEILHGTARAGAFVASVNGSPVDTSTGDTLHVGPLLQGKARLRVEALDESRIPFEPPVFDEIDVFIRSQVENAPLQQELESYVLEQNYPNPFNGETEIRFTIPTAGHVTVRVFNLLGQEVALLLDSDLEAGAHRVRWDGLNDSGKRVSSGIYMVRLQSGPYVGTRRMLFVK